METPSADEIRIACEAITAEGPASPANFALSNLVRLNNHLRWYLEGAGEFLARRMYGESPRPTLVDDAAKSMIAAALVAGLNYGLRIGEARGLPKKP